MAACQLLPNSAWIKVEIAFADNWNAASPVWTDVTSKIRFSPGAGVSWTRGRNDEFQQITPGTFTITFDNRLRDFDPSYTASPYYPNIVPARPCRITCYWPSPGTAYIQFIGQVEDWVPQWLPGNDSICVATGIELLGALSFYRIAASGFISLTAVLRLKDLCNLAGIPAAQQDFVAGSYALKSQTYTNIDILSACQEVVDGQSQVFYSTRAGIVSSRDMFNALTANQGTFGDAPGELPYSSLQVGVGLGYWYTQVQMTAAAATSQVAPPTVSKYVGANYSVSKYGTRVYSRNIAAVSQADAQGAANDVAASLNARAGFRVRELKINPLRDPIALWPKILNTDFGTLFTVKHSPPPAGTPRFSQNAIVRSIRHDVSASGWAVTLMMSPQ